MTAGHERAADDAGGGTNFMETLKKELADDEAVMQRANRRLHEDPGYVGPEKRRACAEEPSVSELVDAAESKVKPWVKIGVSIAAAISALVGWGVVVNPYWTRVEAQEAQAAIDRRFEGVEGRVGKLEGVTTEILTTNRETQELQLMDRIQQIEDRMARVGSGSDVYTDFRRQKLELEQRLTKVRAALGRP